MVAYRSPFVSEIMLSREALPRARALVIARTMCRHDITLLIGGQRDTGARSLKELSGNMHSLLLLGERCMRGRPPRAEEVRAAARLGTMNQEQRMYIWFAFADSYLFAARCVGLRPSERDLWSYLEGAASVARTLRLNVANVTSVDKLETIAARTLGRVAPAATTSGGWNTFALLTQTPWFTRDNEVRQLELHEVVQRRLPAQLLSALKR